MHHNEHYLETQILFLCLIDNYNILLNIQDKYLDIESRIQLKSQGQISKLHHHL